MRSSARLAQDRPLVRRPGASPARTPALPEVTVVLVCFNQARFLAEAFESVLSQSFQRFDVVAVDDGSDDGSLELIEHVVRREKGRVRCCHHPGHENRGIASAYALGIEQARGGYVAFLEADDRWGRRHLEQKVEILNARPDVGVVCSPYRVVGDGWYGSDMVLRQFLLRLTTMRRGAFDNFEPLLRSNNVATFSAVVARRALLEEVSLALPDGLLFLDWWVLAQLGLRARFCLDRTSVIRWRLHTDSALGRQTRASQKAMVLSFLPALYGELGRQLDGDGGTDGELLRRYRSHLVRFSRFYERPDVSSFVAFLRQHPRWAIEALASHVVNRWKYA